MLKYRPTNAHDKDLLTRWIADDPDHKEHCTPDFWLTPSGDTECMAVEDEHGPIFFVRSETVRRLHVQFATGEHRRLVVALDQFVMDMKRIGSGAIRQFIFDSVFGPLIKFLKRRGVRPSPNEYVLDL